MDKLRAKISSLHHHHSKNDQVPIRNEGADGASNDKSSSNNNPNPPGTSPKDPELLATTQAAIDVFLASKQPDGEIGGIGYWQTANGYTAIALHDKWSTSTPAHPNPEPTRNTTLLRQQLSAVGSRHKDFINEFNDDTLWWALCSLETMSLDRDARHGATARRIWQHVAASAVPVGKYNVPCAGGDQGGGIFWTTKPDEQDVNAITTALFAELGARLAVLESGSKPDPATAPFRREYLRAAEAAVNWVFRCRFRDADKLVLDTVKVRSGECMDWSFTYCTGQTIAACVALSEALEQQQQQQRQNRTKGEPQHYESTRPAAEYLRLACEMAEQSMCRPGWVEADGTLTEKGAYGRDNHEAWRNDDAVGFKSVLVRALAKLYVLLSRRPTCDAAPAYPGLAAQIAAFLHTQFRSLRDRDTNGRGQYGPWWDGPMDLPTSHSQLAVLDVMAAIHLVSG